ncbi:hypothetical protein CCP2SC5_200004 [Azospirillaceae bacterium]
MRNDGLTRIWFNSHPLSSFRAHAPSDLHAERARILNTREAFTEYYDALLTGL